MPAMNETLGGGKMLSYRWQCSAKFESCSSANCCHCEVNLYNRFVLIAAEDMHDILFILFNCLFIIIICWAVFVPQVLFNALYNNGTKGGGGGGVSDKKRKKERKGNYINIWS